MFGNPNVNNIPQLCQKNYRNAHDHISFSFNIDLVVTTPELHHFLEGNGVSRPMWNSNHL